MVRTPIVGWALKGSRLNDEVNLGRGHIRRHPATSEGVAIVELFDNFTRPVRLLTSQKPGRV